ncbi:MAG: flagellar hook-basal body protein [Defluviitaleaceae bacterium]|nr:flagellar hook-basal body protein [Defluviitaleaceae bacterium]
MLRGIYNSALGMNVQMQRMDVIANNLANADTLGFKRNIVITQSFSDVLTRRIREYDLDITSPPPVGMMSLGSFVHTTHTDFAQGGLQVTGSPLDLAIDGLGWFEISYISTAGETIPKFTRDGSFTLNQDGMLTTMAGFPVNNISGAPIFLPTGEIIIAGDGSIIVNEEIVDQIRIVSFEDPQTLRAYGHNLLTTTAESYEIPFEGRILQGHLENSNVNSVREMVDLITTARAFEANQRMMTIRDGILGQAVSEIARR